MSALSDTTTKLRDLGRRLLARPIAYLSGEWERLAPKQRRNLAILIGSALGVVTLFGAYLLFSGVADLEEDNAQIREVDLQSLTKFMRRLETGPRLIFFTRLSLKRSFSDTKKLAVDATATAFEHIKEEKAKKKPGDTGKKEP